MQVPSNTFGPMFFFSKEGRPFLLFGIVFCRLFSCARFCLVGNLITARGLAKMSSSLSDAPKICLA